MKTRSTSTKSQAGRILGQKTFAAISAVEGLKLTREGKQRVGSKESLEARRAEVIRAYSGSKHRK